MNDIVHVVTIGGVLHDVGKLIYRAGTIDGRSHSVSGADFIRQYSSDQNIIDCIRFHHKQELNEALLDASSPAYIVYIADNISSGTDRRKSRANRQKAFLETACLNPYIIW